jgi:hypothetical protein
MHGHHRAAKDILGLTRKPGGGIQVRMQLIQADRGGIYFPPKLGLHSDVAEVD